MENRERIVIPNQLFVTGTDTDIGKTVVSAALCAGLPAGYWKPVQAGTEPETDTGKVRFWTGLPDEYFYPETFQLKLPRSPHAASEAENIRIDLDDFELPEQKQEHLVVEGAGGLLVPVNRRDMILDLIRKLDIPVLLVAKSGLGTINHTLMSLHMLKHSGIDIWGVVLNGDRHESNEDAIRHFSGIRRVYSFPRMNTITSTELISSYNQTFRQYASS